MNNLEAGISIRERQVRVWLGREKFIGTYLLVSTKPDSLWSQRLKQVDKRHPIVIDLYTPLLLEKALTFRPWNPRDWIVRREQRATVRKFLARGNHFLVANRRQREYWVEESQRLGAPITHRDISVLPTGGGEIHNSEFIIHNSARRNVVLWFGGIYPWIDPVPLVRAFGREASWYPHWKLRILGGFFPESGYERRYRYLIKLATRLIGENQLDIIDWQSAATLSKFFKDAALVVHLARQTDEDYYAHRVRLLTVLNAGIGVLTSGRDVISDLLVKLKAGMKITQSQDTERMLVRVMNEPALRQQWSNNALRVETRYMKQESDIKSFSI